MAIADMEPDPNLPSVETTLEDRDSAPWLRMISDAESYFDEWNRVCDNLDDLYGNLNQLAESLADREYQMFWANIEVLKPACYARPPQPVVTPRYRRRDPLARRASEILQRATEVDVDRDDLHETLKMIRDDLLIPGRGTVWMRLHADRGIPEVDAEHVDRRDFLHEPARKWREVGWVARRIWLDREALQQRFPDVWTEIHSEDDSANPGDEDKQDSYHGTPKAPVWEIWHKRLNLVVWVSDGCEYVLDAAEPHLTLEKFFPCPKPVYNTLQRGTLKPVPDALYYKDQLEEINELTARLSSLCEAIQMRGFYPGGSGELADVIETAIKSVEKRALLVPVSSYAALGQASLKDSIVWLPIGEVVATVQQLIDIRRQVIDDVYQITGLSDIMRGDTVASETLGAQQLKAQYGSVRIRDRQGEMVRFAADVIRLKAEIMAEEFDIWALLIMSQTDDLPTMQQIEQKAMPLAAQMRQLQGMATEAANNPQVQQQASQNPQQAQQTIAQMQQQMQGLQQQLQDLRSTPTVEAVDQLLKAENVRPFRLEVETDSTIQPDEQAEKIRRTEFLQAVGSYVSSAMPMVQEVPQTAGFVAEGLKFAASGFRAGRQMDDALDEFVELIRGYAQTNKPDPQQQEMQLKAAGERMKQQMEAQKAAFDAQERTQRLQLDAAQAKGKLQVERDRLQLEREKLAFDSDKALLEKSDRDAERAQGTEREYVKAGFPPGYTKDDFEMQLMKLAEAMTSSVQQVVEASQQRDMALMERIEALDKAIRTPKRIVRNPKTGRAEGVALAEPDDDQQED